MILSYLLRQLLRDIKRIPAPTVFALICVMAVIFFVGDLFARGFPGGSVVPADVASAWQDLSGDQTNSSNLWPFVTLLTAVLLHGDFQHWLGNMVFMWPFASLASRLLGRWNVVWIFAVTGIIGNVLQICLDPNSIVPVRGASGAVLGFEGVYVGLLTRWRLNHPHVWPLAHPVSPARLAVFALVGVGMDVYRLLDQQVGVAFGAHIGGFVAGLLIGILWASVAKNPER